MKATPEIASLLLLAVALACTPRSQFITLPGGSPATVDPVTKLVGEGRLSHEPEFISLTVTVHSECYKTPMAASQATDTAVAKVMGLLRKATDPKHPKDGVFSLGGFTQPFSRYVNNKLTLCRGTFQKTARVIMKSSRVAEFAVQFAKIQDDVLSGTLRPPANNRGTTGSTYASLGTPKPQIFYETRERLEQEALALAITNARKKFVAAAEVACKSTRHRIRNFVEGSASSGRPIAYGRANASTHARALEFDAIWINKLLDVYFVIDPGSCKTH